MHKLFGVLLMAASAFFGFRAYEINESVRQLDDAPGAMDFLRHTEELASDLYMEQVYIFGRAGRTNFDDVTHFLNTYGAPITPFLDPDNKAESVQKILKASASASYIPDMDTEAFKEARESFVLAHKIYQQATRDLLAEFELDEPFDPMADEEKIKFLQEFIGRTEQLQDIYLSGLGSKNRYSDKLLSTRKAIQNIVVFMAKEHALVAYYYNNQKFAPPENLLLIEKKYPDFLEEWANYKEAAYAHTLHDGSFRFVFDTIAKIHETIFSNYVAARTPLYSSLLDPEKWGTKPPIPAFKYDSITNWSTYFLMYIKIPLLMLMVETDAKYLNAAIDAATLKRAIFSVISLIALVACFLTFMWPQVKRIRINLTKS